MKRANEHDVIELMDRIIELIEVIELTDEERARQAPTQIIPKKRDRRENFFSLEANMENVHKHCKRMYQVGLMSANKKLVLYVGNKGDVDVFETVFCKFDVCQLVQNLAR